ncbi:unnamed protein product [Sphenostylis stenocarpa]|uniref:Uncharacterized protein n=1 Tax=Sphenostylis stenocarpa TaxID=92480 RepID=A0AA86S1Z6_9FABA|nr:unnamed protein product [Sphenostylis stenocarpa]
MWVQARIMGRDNRELGTWIFLLGYMRKGVGVGGGGRELCNDFLRQWEMVIDLFGSDHDNVVGATGRHTTKLMLDGGILAHIFVIVSAAVASAAHGIIFPSSNAGVVIHESRFCSSFTLLHTRAVVAEFPSELLSISSLVVLKPLEQILSLYPAIERKCVWIWILGKDENCKQ